MITHHISAIAPPKNPSPYFYAPVTANDLDPDLTDLLGAQFELEREKNPSQRWLDMEEEWTCLQILLRSVCLYPLSYPTAQSFE